MADPKVDLKSLKDELNKIEEEITATKQHLADLKHRRRALYLKQSDLEQAAMARAAAEMGLDYDTFRSKINRYGGL